jgi:transposase
MKAYFIDLRTMKVVKSVSRSVSKSEAARRYGVNCSTVARYLKRLDENGALAPKKAPGSRPKLNGIAMRWLEEDIENRPWATGVVQKNRFCTEITKFVQKLQ